MGWLEQVLECTDTKLWPGPMPVEEHLAIPSWAMAADKRDAVDFSGVSAEEEDVQKAG